MLPNLPDVANGARIDWERVVMDIQRSMWLSGKSERYSDVAIARACGRGKTWTWALRNIPGTEPKFHDALLLLGLWAEKTGGTTLPHRRESERIAG